MAMTVEDVLALAHDNDPHECVFAHRFTGRAKTGARVDMRCQICHERVSLYPVSVELVLHGAYLFCMDCYRVIERAGALKDSDRIGVVDNKVTDDWKKAL